MKILLLVLLVCACSTSTPTGTISSAVEIDAPIEEPCATGLGDLSNFVEAADVERLIKGCVTSNEHPIELCCLGESDLKVQCCWERDVTGGRTSGKVTCGALNGAWSGW